MPFYPTEDRLPWAEGGEGNFRSAALVGGRPPPLSAYPPPSTGSVTSGRFRSQGGGRGGGCARRGWRKGEGNQF